MTATAGTRKRRATLEADVVMGTRWAYDYVRRLGVCAWTYRTFCYHIEKQHIPALKVGDRWLLWPHELRTHFRREDAAPGATIPGA